MMTGMKICLVFAPKSDINKLLSKPNPVKKSTGASKAMFDLQANRNLDISLTQSISNEVNAVSVTENDSVIVNLVNQMILNAIEEDASDIHIEIFNNGEEASIRFRRDGNMEHFANFPRGYHKAVVSRIKIMANLDISEMRRPQDGKISINLPDGGHSDLRVATIPTMPGVEFVTIRVLSSGEPLSLSDFSQGEKSV